MRKATKLTLIIAVVIITAIILSGCTEEQAKGNNNGEQVIQTYGEAEVTAEPDLARISFEVETYSRSADEAVAENAELANQVREALLDFGLSEDEIRTGSYRLRSRRERPQEIREPVRPEPDAVEEPYIEEERDVEEEIYYQASNEIMVNTSDLDQVGELIDTAVRAGVNKVNYISFDLEDPQQLKMQALEKAVEQASQKAEAIADSAGKSVTDLYSIIEERTDYTPYRAAREVAEEALEADVAPTPIEPQEVEVRAAVTAKFTF